MTSYDLDGNYAGQKPEIVSGLDLNEGQPSVIDTSGTRARPNWIEYALGRETVIVPITVPEHPQLQKMLERQGLQIGALPSHDLRPAIIAENGRPEADES